MKIYENGIYRNMTDEEIQELRSQQVSDSVEPKPTPDDALNEFITTLASSETTSIAKIRAAAQKFLDNTTEEK